MAKILQLGRYLAQKYDFFFKNPINFQTYPKHTTINLDFYFSVSSSARVIITDLQDGIKVKSNSTKSTLVCVVDVATQPHF